MTISSMAAGVTGDIVTADKYNSLLSLRSVSGGYVTRSGTNLLFAPAVGIHVLCYESSTWVPKLIPAAGITVACTGLTVSTAYYLYVYDNAGTLTLDLNTTAPTTQDGISVKTGALTRTLIARCYADAAGAITTYAEDASTQLLCNIYNRRLFHIYKTCATDNWTYNANTWATMDSGGTGVANRVVFVGSGVDGVTGFLQLSCLNAGGNYGQPGIDLDGTTANDAPIYQQGAIASNFTNLTARYVGIPPAGMHWLQAMQKTTNNTAAVTFYGRASAAANEMAGIMATVMA